MASTLTIGTAPDSWGVWFPSDPAQVPASTFLREVAEAGYEAIELGPYGYLPTDPEELRGELDRYGLSVLAGTVFSRLHQPDSWDFTWRQVTDVAALTRAVGGQHVVVIPAMYRDEKTGAQLESPDLTAEQWERLTSQTDELGRRVREEYGLALQFHPHAESHVGYQPDVERFLESTDPAAVNLCLDTGHIAYYGGDSVELITRYPERIGYVHLKQVDPAVMEVVRDKDVVWPEAVRMGAMTEPPLGVPDMPPVLEALAGLGRDLSGIIEHDLYPCPPDLPLPIARRTKAYLSACSDVQLAMGEIR
ncbi:TIM barrel protein [Microlunatus capsulatus]|uniref:Inosose dehydratase n=1 Tax=Microlunatus capsulatus TaxID=99117 RepID=A0ABS4Z5M6_9ACTN|nr:TIM barrel protein [Microlunatus capsulatus]MBP2416343.1 inosose dehydratase [Microlunatus capsulatus]